jgi:hypothetical protein
MRQRWRTALLTFLLVSLLTIQVVQPVLAAPITAPITTALTAQPIDPTAYGVQCSQGVCTLRIKDAGIAVLGVVAAGVSLLFSFLQEQIRVLPEGAGLQITDDVTIQTPMGKLALFDTDMIVQLAADQTIERLRGTAQIPWPSFGGATDGVEHALALADIGLEPGKYLGHLNLPLAADQAYFYLRLGAGLQTDATGAPQRTVLHAIDTPVTRGQYLTLLIDPQKLDLLIDGNLTIALLDDWLQVNQFLTDQTGLPFELASEAVNFHVSGLLSPDLAASYLQLDGLYTLEKQFIRNWFQTDASPLAVTGSLRVDGEGLLFNGLTRSSVLPDRLFDGEMRVEAFLPMNGSLWNAYIATATQANAPLWMMAHENEQRFTAESLQPLVDSTVATVATTVQPLFLVVKDNATDAVVYAGRGYHAVQDAASDGYAWSVETLIDGATSASAITASGIDSVTTLAAGSYNWTTDLLANGATATANAARTAYAWTATQVTTGATTAATATTEGYRATLDLAGDAYAWTANTTTTGAATVSALTADSYTALACGVTTQVDRITTWLWPSAQAATESPATE